MDVFSSIECYAKFSLRNLVNETIIKKKTSFHV